ncbi:hypothetical protein ABIB94_008065 [Bradyrhizobium sp. JR7.2]
MFIDQSTPGSTIDITARIATERRAHRIRSVLCLGPPFREAVSQDHGAACSCFRFSCRSGSRWPTLRQHPGELAPFQLARSWRASKRRVAQRHHAAILSHSFAHVAASSPFCPITAKRLRHVRRECDNERSLLLDKSSGVYDPEDLAKLGNLFDQAIASLPTCMRTSENRVAIARLVMQRAARDELAPLANLMLALVSAA